MLRNSRHSRCAAMRQQYNMLLVLGLWISNTIIGCRALPRPQNYDENFAVGLGAPLITPLIEELTLEPNTNYVLHCEANEPIVWKTPQENENTEMKKFSTTDPDRPFGMELHLNEISYRDVGSYYCLKQSAMAKSLDEMAEEDFIELVNNNQATTIYVFVNDKEHLLADVASPIFDVHQYSDATIPCKPTMPDIEVLLTGPDGVTHSSKNTGRYDPRRGFVINIRALTDSGVYTCLPAVPSPDNEDEQAYITIIFIGNDLIDNRTTTTKTPLSPMETITVLELPTTKNASQIMPTASATTTTELNVESTVTNKIISVTNSIIGDSLDVVHDTNSISRYGDGVTNLSALPAYNDDTYYNEIDSDSNIIDNDDIDVNIELNSVASNSHVVRHKRAAQTTPPTRRTFYNHDLSTPRSKTDFINKPKITSSSRGHVYEGETFELNCTLEAAIGVQYDMKWSYPKGLDTSRAFPMRPSLVNPLVNDRMSMGASILTVQNAQKSDSGVYTCKVQDHSNKRSHNTYTMTVLSRNESYLNISEPAGNYNIREAANRTIMITVKYRGFPWPTLKWYKPDGTEILNNEKYQIDTTDTTSTLKMKNVKLLDTGAYIVHASNEIDSKELKFIVNIDDAPLVSVENVYVQANETAHVVCTVNAQPNALVAWVFTPCDIKPRWPNCKKNADTNFTSKSESRPGKTSIEMIYDLFFVPEKPGIISCWAQNRIGRTRGRGHVIIGDIEGNMTITGVDDKKKIARGDEVVMTCAALAYYYADDLFWYKDGELVQESDSISINNSVSDYSFKKSLKFKSIQDHDRGTYECRTAFATSDEFESRYANIFVHEPAAPKMIFTNLDANTKLKRKLGDPLELQCKAEAIPHANVDWYKDDVKIEPSKKVLINHEEAKLTIPHLYPDDDGTYRCVVSNRLGVIESSVTVKITNLPSLKLGWIMFIVFVFLLLVALVIYLFIRVNRERKLLRELKAAGLANFEEGAVEHINPALTLDEQADLLPYNRNFEFPRDKLKLGKQLGAGAFGVVLKAFAEGIKPDEKETVVAVKMVKRTADNEVVKALVSELKIMVHLGQHLNVVNLLGAVTKNIAKRELMVIVEYCRYGNVQNFLLRNRKRFINQINPETDKIDHTIMTQRFSDNFEYNRCNSDNDPRAGTRPGRPNSRGYLRQSDLYEGAAVNTGATDQTVMTTIPDDENVMSNNSVQPAWRSNYKPDSTEAMTVTTSDLVSWAFQVARGMEYLSSRKVLHGDLAARNILLCEDNVVKICDFGLARSMYRNDNYKKQGEAPLPIKWLALESLSDHVFSTYTDIWSFGIVLWEFFSLAKVPYPGMDPNQSLYLKLKDGYRMEKPPYANDELYQIMLACWRTNPESRPSFHELEKNFANMLGDEVASHYVDLNDPYMRVNDDYKRRTETDYLALMGSPDELAPPPPSARYVNGHILPEIRIHTSSDDYLQMNTNDGNAIFSPTRPNDYESNTIADTAPSSSASSPLQQHSPTMANNLDSPSNKLRKKDGIEPTPEEIPMLHKTHLSDSDGEQDSPTQKHKFANILKQTRTTPTPSPRHHIAETKLINSKHTSDDNYVNVKSPTAAAVSSGRAIEAISNPSYQMLKKNDD